MLWSSPIYLNPLLPQELHGIFFKQRSHNKATPWFHLSPPLALDLYVYSTTFNRRSTSNPKCHVTFSKTKMNVNYHPHFLLSSHFNVTCLVLRVNSIFNVSIDAWFFLHKSQSMSNSKLCMSIDAPFFLPISIHITLNIPLFNHVGRLQEPTICQLYFVSLEKQIYYSYIHVDTWKFRWNYTHGNIHKNHYSSQCRVEGI